MHIDPTIATVRNSEFVTSNYSTTSVLETPALMYYIYIFTALISLGTPVGAISCCIYKLTLRWKRSLRESTNANNYNYYEVIDPIYETIGTQIKVENNDACKSIKLNETNSHASVEIDIENNEAYTSAVQMEHNKSYIYQGLPFDLNSLAVVSDGCASTQDCCENMLVYNDESIQRASSGQASIHTSQNDGPLNCKFQNQGEFIPLCTTEGVDMDSSVPPGSYSSAKQQQLGFNKLELCCERQSINSKEIGSHTKP